MSLYLTMIGGLGSILQKKENKLKRENFKSFSGKKSFKY